MRCDWDLLVALELGERVSLDLDRENVPPARERAEYVVARAERRYG